MRWTELALQQGDRQGVVMADFDDVWRRVVMRAGEDFETARGLRFTYRIVGSSIRVRRDGREINRSLSRTNFREAIDRMPAKQPSDIKDRQGASYVWGILMDPRIRTQNW